MLIKWYNYLRRFFCLLLLIVMVILSGQNDTFADAAITITTVPTYGTTEDVSGIVSGVDFSAHVVAPYIYVGTGWWTKPTFASPTVPINVSDGTWTADITTHENDKYATRIAVFLIPQNVDPPQASGQSTLPESVFSLSLAWGIAYRGPEARFISFAGYEWRVKHSDTPVGPGPNLFSSEPSDVWADSAGLHMSIVRRDEKWYCTEVILQENFGYGTYMFQTRGRLDILEPFMVAGFFTWDDYAAAPYREIDFEYSRWGIPEDTNNAQFVIQPWDVPGNRYRYRVDLSDTELDLTHVMDWAREHIRFRVFYGQYTIHNLSDAEPVEDWTYTGSGVPEPGLENFRINFWLNEIPPEEFTSDTAFVVTDFEYKDIQAATTASWISY